MQRFEFDHASPDIHIVLFIVLVVMVIAFFGLVLANGRADKEQAERFRSPYQHLDKEVKMRLLKSDPEFYGKIFRDME